MYINKGKEEKEKSSLQNELVYTDDCVNIMIRATKGFLQKEVNYIYFAYIWFNSIRDIDVSENEGLLGQTIRS